MRPAFAALRGRLRRSPFRRELLLGTVGVLALVLVVVAYSFSLGQVFLVEARSFGATVTFQGHGNAWQLPPLALCEPRARPMPGAAAPPGGICDPVGFLEHRLDAPVGVVLPEGMAVKATADVDGRLKLRVVATQEPALLAEGIAWSRGGVVVVAPEDWRRAGVLGFEGSVAIGSDVGSGEAAWLVEGRYQIRERLIRQWLAAGAPPVEVAAGELLRGDRVEFRARTGKESVLARGFIAPSVTEGEPGLLVSAASNPDLAGADFFVASFGAREVEVDASWTDRATNDPLLIALGAVVAFVSGVIGLALRAAGKRDD